MVGKKLSKELLGGDKILKNAKEVYIASASISLDALDLFLRNIDPNVKIHFLIGIHLASQYSAFEKLVEGHEQGKWAFKVFVDNFFHPKLYLLQGDGFTRGFVGSGNFTLGGWFKNEELFHVFEDFETYETYRSWFFEKYEKAYFLDKAQLPFFRSLFERKAIEKQQDQKEIQVLKNVVKGEFNLDTIDFEGQFFSKEDHLTFSPENASKENDAEVEKLRKAVRVKLFSLHDRIWTLIQQSSMNLDKHYIENDVVASTELSFHNSNELSSLWIHYGRSKSEIKKYGEDKTPLVFARLQVIIHYDDVGIWLRFGKAGGSKEDRAYFHSRIKEKSYRDSFFDLCKSLGSSFWIEIGEARKFLNEFKGSEELHDFVKRDNWKTDYFIIGNKIKPDDKELSDALIADTVLEGFKKLYPLYVLMKDKSFE
jgi:hypothetical protein